MSGYSLSRKWFEFATLKKEAKVTHTALYLWIVELNNRLSWKQEFGLPSEDTMQVLKIGNRNTYYAALNDLKEWGFIIIVQVAKNRFQSTVISLVRDDGKSKAKNKIIAVQKSPAIDTATNTATDTPTDTANDTTIDTASVHIDKQIQNLNTKPLKTEGPPPKKEKAIDFLNQLLPDYSFGDEVVLKLKILVCEKKWSGKSINAIRGCLTDLTEYEDEFSLELIKKAISGGYQGLTYPETKIKYQEYLKNKSNVSSGNQSNNTTGNDRIGRNSRDEIEDLVSFGRTLDQVAKDRQNGFGGNNSNG